MREARLEDLEAIVALLKQLQRATSLSNPIEPAVVRETFRAMFESPQVYRNFVAVEDGRVVGLLSLVLYRTLLHAGGTALINELVVAEGARGRGIGGRLVETAAEAARECGMDEIEVGTERENRSARRFYRRAGFDRQYVLFGREFDCSEG